MSRLYARWFSILFFLSLVCFPAAGQVQSGEKRQAPANVANAEDPLPRGALARLGTLRWRHTQPISFIAILPDGGTVLTVCQDQTVHLWDLNGGKQLRQFGPPQNPSNYLNSPIAKRMLARRPDSLPRLPSKVFAALSADGKLLVSCGADGPIHLWDVPAGTEVRTIDTPALNRRISLGGREVVTALALSADGQTLAGAQPTGDVDIWSTSTGAKMGHLALSSNKGEPTRSRELDRVLALSHEGQSLFDVRDLLTMTPGKIVSDQRLRIWDLKTGKVRSEGKDESVSAGGYIFSPSGNLFARIHPGGAIDLVDANSLKVLAKLQGPQRGFQLFFLPDSRAIVIQDFRSQEMQLWSIEQMGPESITVKPAWKIHTPGLDFYFIENSVAFNRRGTIFAAAQDHTVFPGELKSGRDLQAPTGHSAAVAVAHFSRDGRRVLTQGNEGRAYNWEAGTGRMLQALPFDDDWTLRRPQLSGDGKKWAGEMGTIPNGIELGDTTSTKGLAVIQMDKNGYSAFAFSPSGKVLAVQEAATPMVHLFDAAKGKEIGSLVVPTNKDTPEEFDAGNITSDNQGLIFSRDGSKLAGSIKGNSIGIWDVGQGTFLRAMTFPDEFKRSPAVFSPDGRSFARVNKEGGVTLWELAAGRPRRYFGKKPKESVDSAADEGRGTAPQLPRLRVRARPVISHQTEAAATLLFSPDNRLLCLGGPDNAVTLWNVATGKQVAQVHGDQGETTCLDFSPDGKRLVSGSTNTTALMWDVAALVPASPSTARLLSNDEIEACWTDLAGDDAAKAFEAICLLSASPKAAVEFLGKHVLPIPPLDSAQVERWIKDLDHRQFQVRNQANHELEGLGERAVPALQKALKDKPSAEVRSRVDELLRKAALDLTGERLRVLRAIELLERAGSAECKELLRSLAKGDGGAMQTREAAESLRRLEGVGK